MISKAIYRRFILFLYKEITTNAWRLCIGILAGFGIFHRPLENVFDASIVRYVLSEIPSNRYNDFIFIFISVASLILFLKRFRDYTPSITTLNILISCTLIYLFYRLFSFHWIFTRYVFVPKTAYADLLLLITVENLFLLIFTENDPVKVENTALLDDNPITDITSDLLGYSTYASQIAKKIATSHFNNAFAIGVNGKWGSGKTSFINMLKNHLKSTDRIIEIDFNGWSSLTSLAIIKDFFDVILEKIAPYHSSIPRLLTRYSSKLSELHKGNISDAFQVTAAAIGGFDTTQDLFQEIDKALKKINKKIIIYIDDLDRLNKEEILEIIRLIRNTANFSNTFFIVSYDRNYIIQALRTNNSYNPEHFLEKIFQLEISLPYFDREVLRKQLSEKLVIGLSHHHKKEIEKFLFGTKEIRRIQFGDWIETMRDVTRLSNSICLNASRLIGEIELGDFILIELLRLKYPSVYQLLFMKTGDFFKPIGTRDQEVTYQLLATKNPSNQSIDDKTELEVYLREHLTMLSVPDYDVNRIISLIHSIFPKSSIILNIKKPPLSIVFPSKFKRYFAYALFQENLSEVEFSKARSMSQGLFNEKISEWYFSGLVSELGNKFEQILTYDNREDFEKVIRALFLYSNLLFYDKVSSYIIDYRKITEKLINYQDKISNLYYPEPQGKDKYKHFVFSLFKDSKSPYLFESSLIANIQDDHDNRDFFPMTTDELGEINFNYLKEYTKGNSIYRADVVKLYWNTKRSNRRVENGRVIFSETLIPDESREVFKNFIFAHTDPFLSFLITPIDPELMLYAIKPIAEDVFKGWMNFEKQLIYNNQVRSTCLAEFKEFYLAFKETGYQKPVKFEFKQIQVQGSML
jgi:Cdc6-like AAA superfamily ATPase